MKKALVSSTESVSYISAWVPAGVSFAPVVTVIPNAMRVAEVAEQAFSVYQTLLWVDCADDVVADKYYWDAASQTITIKPQDAPYPQAQQPTTQGTQSL